MSWKQQFDSMAFFDVSFSRLWLKSSITYQISLSWCTCWLWFKVWFVVNMMCDVWSVVYCSGGQWRGKHWNCPLIFPPQGLLSLPAQSTACLSWIKKKIIFCACWMKSKNNNKLMVTQYVITDFVSQVLRWNLRSSHCGSTWCQDHQWIKRLKQTRIGDALKITPREVEKNWRVAFNERFFRERYQNTQNHYL